MNKKTKFKELPPDKLRWRCDPCVFGVKTTDELVPCEAIIGQKRAIDAIRLGLDIESVGYNIFVVGLVGTGRSTTIKHLLERLEKKQKPPDDKCYVNNFRNSDMPKLISLPAGKGKLFKKDMGNLIESLKKNIPQIFESENYEARKKEIVKEFQDRQKAIVEKFDKKVKEQNFSLVQIQMGPFVKPDLQPIIQGKPKNLAQLEKLKNEGKFPEAEFKDIQEKYAALVSEMEEAFKRNREIARELDQALSSLDTNFVLPLIKELITEIKSKYKNEKVNQYLDEAQESLISDLSRFMVRKGEKPEAAVPGLPFIPPALEFTEYQVNVIVDNSETKGAPIIIETNPTYRNLFGTVERAVDRSGVSRTDFTKIRGGSLLQANGGYLVFNALDTLIEPGVWPVLKRTLRNRIFEMQSYDPFYLITTSALKPEPIGVDVKVVMIGDAFLYQLLYHRDEDFKKIFKVKADFDSVMPREKRNVMEYASFIKKICDSEKLIPFDSTGVAVVVEFGVRLAGRQSKLSTRFTVISDLIREASYWAKKVKSKSVTRQHVEKAIDEWIRRVSLIEDKIQELIDQGIIMIDTEGEVVGQINGLSVLDMGDYAFGKPTRITAETSVGRAGVINIEREADLSGKTHNKGVLILSGYMRGKYAQDKPLVMSASLCFEQSYSGVDGDSASSTEVYAILSSLSGLPIRQDVAVTGSVNQKGEIQPIGGVNEKIEGFYEVCKAKELTATQGVMIPHQNVEDLMLRSEVVEAAKKGKFHIYAVESIDQGIEILTGVKAGRRKKDGTFGEGTVNYLVDQKLKELAKKSKEMGAPEKSEK